MSLMYNSFDGTRFMMPRQRVASRGAIALMSPPSLITSMSSSSSMSSRSPLSDINNNNNNSNNITLNGNKGETYLPMPSSPYQMGQLTYPTSPLSLLPGSVPLPNIIASPVRSARPSSSKHATPLHPSSSIASSSSSSSSSMTPAAMRAIIQRTPRRTAAELLLVKVLSCCCIKCISYRSVDLCWQSDEEYVRQLQREEEEMFKRDQQMRRVNEEAQFAALVAQEGTCSSCHHVHDDILPMPV
jgi:hypothetical protein